MTRHSSFSSRWHVLGALAFGVLLVGSSTASAAIITFDFEALSAGTTTLVTTAAGGVTLTVRRQDNQNMSVLGPLTAAFGNRSISNLAGPFNATVVDSTLIFSFSAPVSSGSISFGDIAGLDDDGTVVLTAMSGQNGSGVSLGSSSILYPSNLGFPDTRTLTVNAGGIQSFLISSNGPAPGTLYFDNVVIDTAPFTVPEPASMVLFGTGLVSVLARRRMRQG